MLYHGLHEQRFLTWGAYFAAIGWMAYSTAKWAPTLFAVLAGAFMAIILVPFYRWLLRWQARRLARDNPSTTGENTHELSPEGVLESSPAWGEASLKWSTFRRIVATPEHIYLYR